MNTLDIVILLLFIPGIIRGITKGFLEQAITLAGIVLSVYVAYHFSSYACNFIQKYITVSETVLHILGFAATLIVVILLAKLITKAVEMASLGWLNRALGFIFSILVTALVLGLIAIVFDTLNVKFELVKTSILQDSVLYGHLKDFGYFVFPYMKQLLSLAS